MTYRGSVAEWERWTGLAMPESGEYVVEGGVGGDACHLFSDEFRFAPVAGGGEFLILGDPSAQRAPAHSHELG